MPALFFLRAFAMLSLPMPLITPTFHAAAVCLMAAVALPPPPCLSRHRRFFFASH